MRPNVGRTERSQPNTSPANSAPPAVDSVIGTPADLPDQRADQRADRDAPPMNATSATSVGRSATPSILAQPRCPESGPLR